MTEAVERLIRIAEEALKTARELVTPKGEPVTVTFTEPDPRLTPMEQTVEAVNRFNRAVADHDAEALASAKAFATSRPADALMLWLDAQLVSNVADDLTIEDIHAVVDEHVIRHHMVCVGGTPSQRFAAVKVLLNVSDRWLERKVREFSILELKP